MRKDNFLLLLMAFLILSVSSVSGSPDVDNVSFTVEDDSGNDVQPTKGYAENGNTIKVKFNFTEAVNDTPAVMLEFWFEGEKMLIRDMVNFSNSSDVWTYNYTYNASNDSYADFLKIDVAEVCNSSGGCMDPDPRKIDLPVYSYAVENTSTNIQNILDDADDGNLIFFNEGIYADVQLNINKSLTLISNTGDYRTSEVVFTDDSWIYVNESNVSITGFRFENLNSSDHNAVIQIARPVDTFNFVLEKNKFLNTSKRGVHQNKGGSHRIASNYLIADNLFEGIGYYHDRSNADNRMTAVFFYGLVNSTIRDNVINGTTFQGMNLGRYGTFNLMILNNSISNTPRSGIQVFDAMDSNITIEGNEIRRTNMDLTGAYLECHRTEQNRAIRSEGGASEDIFNVLEVISNNDGDSFKTWDRDEARACFPGVGTPNKTIVRTLVHNVEAGIMIDGASGITIRDNVITNNHDGIVICPSYCGISNHSYQFDSFDALNESADALIENNVIHSNEGRDAEGYNHYSPLGIQSGYNVIYGGGGVIRAVGNYWGMSEDPGSTFSGGDFGAIRYVPYHLSEYSEHKNLSSEESNVFEVNKSGIVQNVSMDLGGNRVSRARLFVAELSSRPENTEEVPSSIDVYGWLEITDDVNDSLVRGADVTFAVSKRWMSSNNVDQDDVVLLRFDGDDWEELNTRVVGETSGEVIFSARTPGFSFFAVAGTPTPDEDDDDDGGRGRSDRIKESAKNSSDGGKNDSSIPEKEVTNPDNGTKKNGGGKETSPPVPVSDEGEGNNFLTWILSVLAGIVVLAVIVAVVTSSKKKKKGKKAG